MAYDVRDASGRIVFRKGRALCARDAGALTEAAWSELHLVRLEPTDRGEEEAGPRLAQLGAGVGCRVGRPVAGHWPIEAAHRGILRVRTDALLAVNAMEGLAVYTLFDGQVVESGEVIARAKIAPFAVAESILIRAESIAAGGVLRVTPFQARRVGAVVNESLGSPSLTRFRDALHEKVAWLGSTLLEPVVVGPTSEAVAVGIRDLVATGADLIVVAGSRAKDPLDPSFAALERLGARIERRGVPAHPGSLAWLARLNELPVLGMPSCGLFSQATVFDLLLPRILAGEQVGGLELAALGHGGFLTRDMAFRFPPYRPARDRGEVE